MPYACGSSPARPVWEGGHCELPEEQRLGLLEAAGRSGATYVDIELQAYRSHPQIAELIQNTMPVDAGPG